MKILAAIFNFALLIFVVVMVVKNPSNLTTADIPDYVGWFLILVTPILNLGALFLGGKAHDWLSLFLQRKALEEKKKMEVLNSKKP